MSSGLVRYHQTGQPHFITFSCTRHRQNLGTPEARELFCTLLEQTRESFDIQIYDYVVMPDHVHLLLTEPKDKLLSQAIQSLKQRFSRTRPEAHIWEPRYYDFNIHTPDKHTEKLKYIHRNPSRRGLVEHPQEWHWSSYRDYLGHPGPVKITLPTF